MTDQSRNVRVFTNAQLDTLARALRRELEALLTRQKDDPSAVVEPALTDVRILLHHATSHRDGDGHVKNYAKYRVARVLDARLGVRVHELKAEEREPLLNEIVEGAWMEDVT